MPRPNFLDRFRPVGAPGPAARTGVPARDALSPADELAPVLAALAGDAERGRAVVADARLEGEQILDTARADAAALVAQARLKAGSERRTAYERVLAAAALDDARLLQQSAAHAAEITRVGRGRVPSAARKIVESLLAESVET